MLEASMPPFWLISANMVVKASFASVTNSDSQ